ncbi:hypothetical protein [Nocardioides yefusunii]|uniref:Uncharacterized protein n=1 Tax=Nocardioides yefusunii TaxID=2500546 RepID=A0ABW1QWB2_9ACTN|nr:hypothetical protein [Nocardioides yefusunii]
MSTTTTSRTARPRPAPVRARRAATALAAVGLVTWGIGAAGAALEDTGYEKKLLVDGGGTVLVQAAQQVCWRLEAHDERSLGRTTVSEAGHAVPNFVREGCGNADVELPGTVIWGATRFQVQDRSAEELAAFVWADRGSVVSGAIATPGVVADGAQGYVLDVEHRGRVLAGEISDAREVGPTFAAGGRGVPPVQVRQRLEAAGADLGLFTDGLEELGARTAARPVGDLLSARADLRDLMPRARNAITYATFLTSLVDPATSVATLEQWFERFASGKAGKTLKASETQLRQVAARVRVDTVKERLRNGASAAQWREAAAGVDDLVRISPDEAERWETARERWLARAAEEQQAEDAAARTADPDAAEQ